MARRSPSEHLSQVFAQAHAGSWDDVLRFLESGESHPSGLSHDQLAELQDDLQWLADREEPFTADPSAAYAIIDALQPASTTIGRGSPAPSADPR
jgi:hypothetical protein